MLWKIQLYLSVDEKWKKQAVKFTFEMFSDFHVSQAPKGISEFNLIFERI